MTDRFSNRSRDELAAEASGIITSARIWIQEHGEKAALFFFLGGILLVLFFKLFVFLLVMGFLAGYWVWFMASPDKRADSSGIVQTDRADKSDEIS